MQRAVEDANMAIEKDGEEEVKIFSMDVESLYPKLDKEDMVETI